MHKIANYNNKSECVMIKEIKTKCKIHVITLTNKRNIDFALKNKLL